MPKPPNLVLRNAISSDKSNILEHLEDIWGSETAAQRGAIWKWLYEENPYLNGKFSEIWIFTDEKKVYGVTFSTPARLLIKNEPVDIQWFGTISVSQNMRDLHQAWKFGKRMRDKRAYGLGFPLERTIPLYKKWADDVDQLHIIGKFGNMVKTLRVDHYVKQKALAPAANLIYRAVDSVVTRINEDFFPGGYTVEKIDRFDDSFDDWFESIRPGFEGLVISMLDQDYLNWRYIEPPVLDYTPFLLRKHGRIKGFFILEEYISNGLPVCSIAEHLTAWKDRRSFRKILSAAVRESRRRNVFAVKILESYIPEVRRLYRRFYFVAGKSSRYPLIFYPPRGSDHGFLRRADKYFICRGMADPKIV